ncbi:MAG: outer membrane protein assembly factor BamB, partial [Candidatus Marinamargulisbacteria bacterium]
HWKSIQGAYKSVLEGFWVGFGERPIVIVPDKISNEWEMIGKNPSNQNYIDAEPPFSTPIQQSWEHVLGAQVSTNAVTAPVIANNTVYLSYDQHLYSLSVETGKVNWDFKLPGQIRSSLIIHEGILFLIREEGESTYLYAMLSGNGSILFKSPMRSQFYSNPILSKGIIYVIEGKEVRAIEAGTGQTLWTQNYNLDFRKYPVVSNGHLILVTRANEVVVCSAKTGNMVWHRQMKGRIFSEPLAYKDHLVVASTSADGAFNSRLDVLTLKEGEPVWTYENTQLNFSLLNSPSVGKNILFVPARMAIAEFPANQEKLDMMVAFDVASGELLWQRVMANQSGKEVLRPIVSSKVIVTDVGQKDAFLIGMDPLTGEELKGHFDSETSYESDLREIVDTRLYKNYILALQRNLDTVKLVCYQ